MKLGAAILVGAGVGFLVGFFYGRGVRDALPSATSTEISGGVLTVRVDGRQALENGLAAFLR